ncbi:hypothetical protein OIU78_003868 [Salix suchowensis]|nr:hypothetical protein OIU78_003868 [Salix suchowensis]
MLAGRVQNANQFSPMGIAFSPILWLIMLHMLSIVTGRKQRLMGPLVILAGLPCLSQLIQVMMTAASIIERQRYRHFHSPASPLSSVHCAP